MEQPLGEEKKMTVIKKSLVMVGREPLIMHNDQAADPLNRYAVAMKPLTAKKVNKTQADQAEIDRLKFDSSLYWEKGHGPVLPARNIFKALMEAASMTRKGKDIERGLVIPAMFAVLAYDGPRDIESLYGDGTTRFVDRRMAAVNRVRIPVVRPTFPEWACEFEVWIEDEILDLSRFEDYAIKAGLMIGVGDFRRFYGKFDATVRDL